MYHSQTLNFLHISPKKRRNMKKILPTSWLILGSYPTWPTKHLMRLMALLFLKYFVFFFSFWTMIFSSHWPSLLSVVPHIFWSVSMGILQDQPWWPFLFLPTPTTLVISSRLSSSYLELEVSDSQVCILTCPLNSRLIMHCSPYLTSPLT
jgi:hypothetical protein